MSDLLVALGDWTDSRIKYSGFWYQLGLAVLFFAVIEYFIPGHHRHIGGIE